MKKPSFEAANQSLQVACESLRSFTLAQRGITTQHGLKAVRRVIASCNRMDKLFATGPHAAKCKTLVALARNKVLAAKARLAVLGVAV